MEPSPSSGSLSLTQRCPGRKSRSDLDFPLKLMLAAAEKFLFALADFFRREIFDVSGDSPCEPEGVFDPTVTVAPKLIGDRHFDFAARSNRLSKSSINIRHVEVKRQRPIAFCNRQRAELGKIVIEHQVGVANANVRVHELAAGSRRSRDFYSAERAFEEIDIFRGALYRKVRRQRAETLRNRILRFGHI